MGSKVWNGLAEMNREGRSKTLTAIMIWPEAAGIEK
jgi:hypothetical protein